MQKLTGISSGQNNKSCRIIHNGSNKLVLHFYDFSTIFYAIYKNQQTHFTILVALLQGGPRKEKFPCNVAPGGGGRRGLGKFRRCAAGFRPGRAREGPTGHWHSVSWVGRGRGGSGGGAHRQPVAATAASRAVARLALAGAVKGVTGKERGGARV
jgi:hypothetical protein